MPLEKAFCQQRRGCGFQASKAHWVSRELISCLGCPQWETPFFSSWGHTGTHSSLPTIMRIRVPGLQVGDQNRECAHPEHPQPMVLLWAAFLRPFLNIKFLASWLPVQRCSSTSLVLENGTTKYIPAGITEETATTTWVSLDVIKYSANIQCIPKINSVLGSFPWYMHSCWKWMTSFINICFRKISNSLWWCLCAFYNYSNKSECWEEHFTEKANLRQVLNNTHSEWTLNLWNENLKILWKNLLI